MLLMQVQSGNFNIVFCLPYVGAEIFEVIDYVDQLALMTGCSFDHKIYD